MRKIILASASPRRRELLEKAGVSFEIRIAGGEEIISSRIPEEVVKGLSMQKAYAVADEEPEGTVIIGADTIVVYRGQILGKPADVEDAVRMLQHLQDATHQVYTGVTLLYRRNSKWEPYSFAECTDVTFYPVSEQEICTYAATGDPLDKAGSYGIQGPFGVYVKGIRGDYSNVMGLPVPRLIQETKKLGFDLRG